MRHPATPLRQQFPEVAKGQPRANSADRTASLCWMPSIDTRFDLACFTHLNVRFQGADHAKSTEADNGSESLADHVREKDLRSSRLTQTARRVACASNRKALVRAPIIGSQKEPLMTRAKAPLRSVLDARARSGHLRGGGSRGDRSKGHEKTIATHERLESSNELAPPQVEMRPTPSLRRDSRRPLELSSRPRKARTSRRAESTPRLSNANKVASRTVVRLLFALASSRRTWSKREGPYPMVNRQWSRRR